MFCPLHTPLFFPLYDLVFCKSISFFFFFWLHWVFVAAPGLSLVAASKQGLLFVAVRGLLIAVASLVVEHGL